MANCTYDKECHLVVEIYNRSLAKIQLAGRYLTPKAITPFSHFIFQEDPAYCTRLAKLFKEGRVSVVINSIALTYEQILKLWAYPDTDSPPGPSGNRYYNQPVIGSIDGINFTFSSPTKFIHLTPDTEVLLYNGVRLEYGAGNDYIVNESIPGTGYDIIQLTFIPIPGDKLLIDFTPAP